MMENKYLLGIADIAAIVVVMMISAGIGVFFRFSGGRQKTTKEFLMAGRTMSPFPVVFSLIVTFVSAIMMLGMPSEVYEFGIYRMYSYFFSTISNVASAYIFLPVYFQMGESVSVYEYLERRFGKLTRKISSVLFIFHSVFHMSVVLYAPALALSTVCNVNIYASIVSIGGVCIVYCCMGGMKAVLWTDVFQAVVMYTCLFAVFIKGILLADISFPEAFRLIHARENRFLTFDPSVRYTIWNCIVYGFLYGLYNYGCNQAQIQRMLTVKSLKLSQRAVIFSIPLGLVFITMNFCVGIIMYANYHDKNLVPCVIKRRDQMVPYFITKSFTDYPGLAGICIAGIFSGSLSTISSALNSVAAVVMEDFVRPYLSTKRKITDTTAAILVKVFAFSFGLAAMLCAFAMKENDIVYGYTVLYGVTAGPILGLFVLGMMTITANEKGVLHGLMSGIVVASAIGVVSFIKKSRPAKVCTKGISAMASSFLNGTTFNNTFSDFIASSVSVNTSTELYSATNGFISTEDDFTSADFFSSTAGIFNSTAYPAHEQSKPYERKEWISIMWLLAIGFGVTTIIGYIASFLKIRSGKEQISDVDPALLSPLVKKWIFKSLPQNTSAHSDELVKLKEDLES